jgi:hypothetical protein
VAIAGAKAGKSSTGLKLTGGKFAAGSIVMSAAPGSLTTGVEASAGEVTGSAITAEFGVQAVGAPVVRGCRITPGAFGPAPGAECLPRRARGREHPAR